MFQVYYYIFSVDISNAKCVRFPFVKFTGVGKKITVTSYATITFRWRSTSSWTWTWETLRNPSRTCRGTTRGAAANFAAPARPTGTFRRRPAAICQDSFRRHFPRQNCKQTIKRPLSDWRISISDSAVLGIRCHIFRCCSIEYF